MLSRGGEIAVAKIVGNLEDKRTDIIIMGKLAQHILLIRKLREQPLVIAKKSGFVLEIYCSKIWMLILSLFGSEIGCL
jgi:hypothetical protein